MIAIITVIGFFVLIGVVLISIDHYKMVNLSNKIFLLEKKIDTIQAKMKQPEVHPKRKSGRVI
ncbi:MAG TPA: hypothetical protein ENH82_19550 [bacterium]|nr:hypothetical protein [bacterium]